jgi:hypothetical protein
MRSPRTPLLAKTVAVRQLSRRSGPVALSALILAFVGCKSETATGPAEQTSAVHLVLPAELAKALIARGGAEVSGSTHFVLSPKVPGGVLGEQNITNTTELALDGQGHYNLKEQNDHDGGRLVHFSGQEIAVKLRYGKLIKRTARGAEPNELLAQALGQPWAAWELMSTRAAVTQSAAADGTQTLTLALATSRVPAPVQAQWDGLAAWRKTAEPTKLQGTLTYLPATGPMPATLIAADISGEFVAKVQSAGATHDVSGKIEIHFQTKNVGKTAVPGMPDDAEIAWTKQRTVLEERALLGNSPSAKANITP